MPWVAEEIADTFATGQEPPTKAPDTSDWFGASIRQNNTLVAIANLATRKRFDPVEGYDALEHLRAIDSYEKKSYLRDWGSQLVTADSPDELRYRIGEIDREQADKEILGNAGLAKNLAGGLISGVADPLFWAFPIRSGARSAYLSVGTLKAAANVAASSVPPAMLQTALLHGMHYTDTAEEAVGNVATATLFGALLGGGAYAIASRDGLVPRMVQALDRDRRKLSEHVGTLAPGETDANAPIVGGIPQSVSAASADNRDLGLVGYGISKVPGVKRALSWAYPNIDVFENAAPPTRRLYANIAESPLLLAENEKGGTTTLGGQVPIDREIKMASNGVKYGFGAELEKQYSLYLSEGERETRSLSEKMPWNRPEGRLSKKEFSEAVTDALNTGDQHENPYVAAAAQWVRRNAYDPLSTRAEASLEGFKLWEGPEGRSYAPQRWNIEAIRGKWNGFIDVTTDWLESIQSRNAEIKRGLEADTARLAAISDAANKIEAKMERLATRRTDLETRLDEMAMEVGRREKRSDVLTDRQSLIAEEVRETKAFIAEMRNELLDPSLTARLDDLERQLNDLQRAEKPVTEADLIAQDEREIKSILTGPLRRAAKIIAGEVKAPPAVKVPSLVDWIIRNGGIDPKSQNATEVFEALGGKGSAKAKRIMRDGGMTVDGLGERLGQEFPNAGGRLSVNDVLAAIDAFERGNEPHWFLENRPGMAERLAEQQYLAMLEEMFHRAGIEIKSSRDVAAVFKGSRRHSVTLEDLDRIAASMEAAGESIPLSLRIASMEETISVPRARISELRAKIRDAIEARDARVARGNIAGARADEAARAEESVRGRVNVLNERVTLAERKQAILDDAMAIAQKAHDDLRGKIEERLAQWEGKTTAEAAAAIKAREKYAATPRPNATGERLRSADKAIDSAVRSILASDRDRPRAELRARAEEIAHRITAEGGERLPYDESMSHEGARGIDVLRGHANPRRFNIPYELAKPFLDRDPMRGLASHLDSVLPDMILAERFGGDPEMKAEIRKIQDWYAAEKGKPNLSVKEQQALSDRMAQDIEHVTALRDRLRGTYGGDERLGFLGRFSQNMLAVNNITSSHGMAVSSIPDFAGTVLRYGFERAFKDAWAPFFKALTSPELRKQLAALGDELKSFGIGVDTAAVMHHHPMSEVTDDFMPRSKFERGLHWMSDKAFLANLLAPLTDAQKLMAGHAASTALHDAARAVANGTATAKQVRLLAENNIRADLAPRIVEQYQATATDVRGVKVPNTGAWADREAAQAFRAAIARETELAVLTPGNEVPAALSSPVVNLLMQYQRFSISSVQRIMLSSLQRQDAQVLAGLVMYTGLGMMAYAVSAAVNGRKTSDNPAVWIKEGMSRGGIFGYLDNINSIAAKATAGKADAYRLIGADEPLSKFVARDPAAILLGPSWNKITTLSRVANAGANMTWTEADSHAVRMVTLGSNFPYLPRLFDAVEQGVNGAFGVPMKAMPQ